MIAKLIPPAVSFAIVFVAYWAYALVAVPLIEPEAKVGTTGEISETDRDVGGGLGDGQQKRFAGLFPADSWVHGTPKILESDRIVLLAQTYHNFGDGRVKITPCTMIFLPAEAKDNPAKLKESVILEAPDGAMLEFDSPLDFGRGKIGQLIGGKLNGRITIRGKGRNPGPNDDLLIVTKNVQLSRQHVWTPHPVDFHLGPNYGRGKDMRIKLLSAGQQRSSDPGTRVDGIESFAISRVERLHLELSEAELPSADGDTRRQANPSSAATDEEKMPVEITCRGPFKFDLIRKVATFKDHVDVIRINPRGPSDQLNCELLSIFFTDRAADDGAVATADEIDDDSPEEGQTQQSLDIEPSRLEARGNPVVVTAPSRKAHARGQVLSYDLKTEEISLESTSEVFLKQEESEIHAKSVKYKPAGEGRLGQLTAIGPGWIRAKMSERPDELLEATWNKELLVRPDQHNQRISLDGGTSLAFRGFGRLDAGEIHFWLNETRQVDPRRPNTSRPNDKAPMRLSPDRMLAKTAVKLNSPQLVGAVEQLQVWFEEKKASGSSAGGSVSPATSTRVATTSPVSERPGVTRPETTDTPRTAEPPKQRFSITGRLLQARVLYREDEETQLSELIIEDGVRFAETQTAKPDEKPLLISGDRLHMTGAEGPNAAATVVGKPAHFEARGLGLTGGNININRGTDRIWVDGVGRMVLPIDRDPQGNKLATPGVMNVDWKKGMNFDGRTATFKDSVVASGSQQTLRTETMEVHFDRHFDLSRDGGIAGGGRGQEPEVEKLICRGGVLMENRTVEELPRGRPTPGRPTLTEKRQTSYDRMQVPDLRINLKNGNILTAGPGWLHSVRLREDTASSLGGLAAPTPVGRDDSRGGEKPASPLVGLHVRFQQSITGNIHRRSMNFNKRVHAAYAPVDSWQTVLDTDDPDELGPQGVVLHCDRLTVTEMKTPLEGRRSMELEAAGNTVVESSDFTARAIRMTYAEGKGLLVFEGDGRNDARLFRQTQLGGAASELAAKRILYWPKTKRWKIDGMRTVMGVEPTSRRP